MGIPEGGRHNESVRDRWLRLWPDERPFLDLAARYSESHRAYHTLQHIEECLREFDASRHLAKDPVAVELAIWFHDAVYDTKAHDNEEKSAELVRALRLPADREARIAAMILATKHAAIGDDPDVRLLTDIDLAILGAPPARFTEYESQIRQEYSWVPEMFFAAKRAEILRGFLARPRIYGSDFFRDRLEAKARENLSGTLKA